MRRLAWFAILASFVSVTLFAQALSDSAEFRSKGFRSAIIKDYSNMTRGDGVDWSWIRPGHRVRNYNIVVRNFKNTAGAPRHIVAQLNKLNNEFTGHQKRDRETLIVETAVYRHVASGKDRGVGVELIYRDSRKWQIAKVRTFRRDDPDEAAEDLVDILEEWTDDH